MVAPNSGNREGLKMQTKEVSYEWSIEDFTISLPYMKDIVTSQKFPRKGRPQWYIRLKPRGTATKNQKFSVHLVLKKAKKGRKSIVVDYNLKFLDDNGTQIKRHNRSGRKFDEGISQGFSINKGSNQPIPLSASGKLIIRVTIFIRKLVQSDPFQYAIETPKSSITADWMKLLKTDEFADFIVESADSQEFPVHKAILAVRNPKFFATMFKTEMKEAGENRVKLPYEREIVSALLEYVYSDAVVNLTPIAAQLYAAAHQYQLDQLVTICAANLSQNLTVANISVALGIAELYDDAKLLSACQKFDSKPSGWDQIRKWFKGAQ